MRIGCAFLRCACFTDRRNLDLITLLRMSGHLRLSSLPFWPLWVFLPIHHVWLLNKMVSQVVHRGDVPIARYFNTMKITLKLIIFFLEGRIRSRNSGPILLLVLIFEEKKTSNQDEKKYIKILATCYRNASYL